VEAELNVSVVDKTVAGMPAWDEETRELERSGIKRGLEHYLALCQIKISLQAEVYATRFHVSSTVSPGPHGAFRHVILWAMQQWT
jgi:hypothetical protein